MRIMFFVLVIAPFFAFKDKEPDRYAQIAIDTAFVDLDTVALSSVTEHTYRITNSGNFPLMIRNVVTSCGCTTSDLKERMIQPGKSTTLTARFDAAKKGLGKQNGYIEITSNSRSGGDTLIGFKAVVVGDSLISKSVGAGRDEGRLESGPFHPHGRRVPGNKHSTSGYPVPVVNYIHYTNET